MMKRQGLFVTLLGLLLLLTGMIGVSRAEPDASTDFMVAYPLPDAGSAPRNIVVEAPGRVWFTLPGIDAIGRLVVQSATDYDFTIVDLPTGSDPFDLVYDGTAVWFTARGTNVIGRVDPTTVTVTDSYPIPTVNSAPTAPTGIDVAPNGVLWFLEQDGNKVAQFDPVAETFTEYDYEFEDGQLENIAVADNNSIWFTAPNINRVSRLTPSSGNYLNVQVVDFNVPPFPPGDIVMGAGGLPWITAPDKGWIGPYLWGTLAIWRWQELLSPDGRPTGLAYSRSDGVETLWYVLTDGNGVGQLAFTTGGTRMYNRERPLPTVGGQPSDIAVDSQGHAWITAPGTNMIVEWQPPYFHFTYLPAIQ